MAAESDLEATSTSSSGCLWKPLLGKQQRPARSVQLVWRNGELATRTAFMCVVVALPVFVPSLGRMYREYVPHLFAGGTATMLIFSVGKDTGTTIRTAVEGVSGIFTSVVVCYLLSVYMMPARNPCEYNSLYGLLGLDGALKLGDSEEDLAVCRAILLTRQENLYDPLIANVVATLSIFLCLKLKLQRSTQIFFIIYHCTFMFQFMYPDGKPDCQMIDESNASCAHLKSRWALDKYSSTIPTFLSAAAGPFLAVIVTLIPYPLRSSWQTQTASLEIVKSTNSLLKSLSDHCIQPVVVSDIYFLEARAEQLQQDLYTAQNYLKNSWWEFLSRKDDLDAMGNHLKFLQILSGILLRMERCASREYVNRRIGELEQNELRCTSNKLVSYVNDLVECMTKRICCVNTCGYVRAIDFDIHAKPLEDFHSLMDEKREKLQTASQEFATRFNTTRNKIGDESTITLELQQLSCFAHDLSLYAKLTDMRADQIKGGLKECQIQDPLATALGANHEGRRRRGGRIAEAWQSIKNSGMQNRLITWSEHGRGWWPESFDWQGQPVRNTISVVLGYYIGLWVWKKASIPTTTAVLLSPWRTSGSTQLRNAARLQGIMLGYLGPFLFAVSIGFSTNCKDSGLVLMRGMFYFCWELMANYLYYSARDGTAQQSIFCLAAAFASSVLVNTSCETADQHTAKDVLAKMFMLEFAKNCLDAMIAVMIVTLVDFVLAPERASTKAIEKIGAALDALLVSSDNILSSDAKPETGSVWHPFDDVLSTNANMKALLDDTAFLVIEASREPRFHRMPWPSTYSNSLICACNALHDHFQGMRVARWKRSELADADAECTLVPLDILKQLNEISEVQQTLKEVIVDLQANMELWTSLSTAVLSMETTTDCCHSVWQCLNGSHLSGRDDWKCSSYERRLANASIVSGRREPSTANGSSFPQPTLSELCQGLSNDHRANRLRSLADLKNAIMRNKQHIATSLRPTDSLDNDPLCRISLWLTLIEVVIRNLNGIAQESIKQATRAY